jgi:phosphoribosylformylglycinamidine cyclo-ligase
MRRALFRNKNLITGDVISSVISGTEQVLAMLRKAGIEITSTGDRTYDSPSRLF